MRAFIIPGDESHLAQIADVLDDEVCGILLNVHANVDDLVRKQPVLSGFSGKVMTLRSLSSVCASEVDEFYKAKFQQCFDSIVSDPRSHYLASRARIDSAFNNTIAIEKIVMNSIAAIFRTDPTQLISSSTPHSLEAWVFAKVFEYFDLPVNILESSPVGLRSWVYTGLDEQSVVPLRSLGSRNLSDATSQLLKEQRDSKPGERDKDGLQFSRIYMGSIADSGTNSWWSPRRELQRLFSGKIRSFPLRLYAMRKKRKLYDSYSALASQELPDNPFVVFFMHYQPERSSLPVGLKFSQQWNAIRLLSMSLPAGWKLLVREHPSTWLNRLDISVRTSQFYNDIAALPGVELSSMDLDTFELIDRCNVVSTLTGNVGFQSIIRGTPAIVFGLASYKDHPACMTVASFDELKRAFECVMSGELEKHFRDDGIETYLRWVEENSVSADSREPDPIQARLKNFAELYRMVFQDKELLHDQICTAEGER